VVETPKNVKKRWDIFCKIVDNFGDIGICWRLAKQLNAEHGLQVRLWVDEWNIAQHLIPSLKNTTHVDGVTILNWHDAADFSQVADVVIEAFSCGLPEQYLSAIQAQKSKWINLEYLSAEPWVDDFHAKPSPQANGLTRHFYFPGFTEKTGGLLREYNTLTTNQLEHRISSNLKISLFCYPHAPIHELLTALKNNQKAVHVFVPTSSILQNVARFFRLATIKAGDVYTENNLTVEVLPFLSQQNYDALLRDCDLNFVRGEDSWIRAIWACKPFIWQPYLQTENIHMQKLKAFIDLFYDNSEQKEVLWKAHEYWAAEHALRYDAKIIWKNYLNVLPAIQSYTKTRAKLQAEQTDLATQLVSFCNKAVFTK
jgi:uncharacterized repeat protein (TIGR03837 family)